MVTISFLIIGFIIIILLASRYNKVREKESKKVEHENFIKIEEDYGKMKSYKILEPYPDMDGGHFNIILNLLVTKNGDILKYSHLFCEKLKHINIKDILEVQVISDGKLLNSIQRDTVDTVLFGGLELIAGILTGKNKKLKILLRINDFDEPEWDINFGDDREEVQSFLSILKVIEVNQKEQSNKKINEKYDY